MTQTKIDVTDRNIVVVEMDGERRAVIQFSSRERCEGVATFLRCADLVLVRSAWRNGRKIRGGDF